jgi:hypothetical protein
MRIISLSSSVASRRASVVAKPARAEVACCECRWVADQQPEAQQNQPREKQQCEKGVLKTTPVTMATVDQRLCLQ